MFLQVHEWIYTFTYQTSMKGCAANHTVRGDINLSAKGGVGGRDIYQSAQAHPSM